MPACSWAKKLPVRPQPTAISSQIRCTSKRSHRAGQAQVFRVVHGHAGGALDQRLDDQRGDAFAVLFEVASSAAAARRATSAGVSPASPRRKSGDGRTWAAARTSGA
jgi:hypothetical protein